MGSIPGPGASQVPQRNQACALQILSLLSRAWEPQMRKPAHPGAHALQQKKPPQREAQAPQLESSPHYLQLEKLHSNQDPARPKLNIFKKRKAPGKRLSFPKAKTIMGNPKMLQIC